MSRSRDTNQNNWVEIILIFFFPKGNCNIGQGEGGCGCNLLLKYG